MAASLTRCILEPALRICLQFDLRPAIIRFDERDGRGGGAWSGGRAWEAHLTLTGRSMCRRDGHARWLHLMAAAPVSHGRTAICQQKQCQTSWMLTHSCLRATRLCPGQAVQTEWSADARASWTRELPRRKLEMTGRRIGSAASHPFEPGES